MDRDAEFFFQEVFAASKTAISLIGSLASGSTTCGGRRWISVVHCFAASVASLPRFRIASSFMISLITVVRSVCTCDDEENFLLPCRCNRDGDSFRGDLDKFHDRFDILDRAGEEFFGKFNPGIHQFLVSNRPWSKRDKPFSGDFFPEVFAGERDERGKEPDPYRAERM